MVSERTQRALFLIAEGYSAQEITQMLGYKGYNTVYNIAHKHHVKIRKAHDKQHDEMRRYKAEGHTMQEVADKFGVSKQTAQQICKGICPQKAKITPRGVEHPCPVCGTITDRPKFCSDRCRIRASSLLWNTRRRIKMQNAMVDEDITLHDLFMRDKGICYICGGMCDWDDHSYKNNHFVSGQTYPTIDHVKPLAKGGKHSWDNVRLAHFVCNSAKGAKTDG